MATRERAEAILDTIARAVAVADFSASTEQAAAMAEELDVPVALIWAALDGRSGDDLDALTAWWPRKERD